jgi:hypothetical protein
MKDDQEMLAVIQKDVAAIKATTPSIGELRITKRSPGVYELSRHGDAGPLCVVCCSSIGHEARALTFIKLGRTPDTPMLVPRVCMRCHDKLAAAHPNRPRPTAA